MSQFRTSEALFYKVNYDLFILNTYVYFMYNNCVIKMRARIININNRKLVSKWYKIIIYFGVYPVRTSTRVPTQSRSRYREKRKPQRASRSSAAIAYRTFDLLESISQACACNSRKSGAWEAKASRIENASYCAESFVTRCEKLGLRRLHVTEHSRPDWLTMTRGDPFISPFSASLVRFVSTSSFCYFCSYPSPPRWISPKKIWFSKLQHLRFRRFLLSNKRIFQNSHERYSQEHEGKDCIFYL